jgi:hypothetical protein
LEKEFAEMGHTPSPSGILESTGYERDRVKIFDFKELGGKIFRRKDLALQCTVPADFVSVVASYI